MPKDDQVFFSDAQAANQALQMASLWETIGMATPKMDRFQHYHNYFRELGRISGGTEPVIEEIKLQILPRLKKYELDNNEGPIQVIRHKLEEWRGPEGSASYRFKNNYLPPLATALENQYSTMQAMAAIMITHEGIIDQARQKYLDLIDNTTAAIEEINRAKRQSSVAETILVVISAVATGAALGSPEGPIGVVAGAAIGAIQGIAGIIDAQSSEPTGDDWSSVTDDALDKLEALVKAVKEDTKGVEDALDEVLVYVSGESRSQYLAPPVYNSGATVI